MTLIMIKHIKRKYTAVGRKEIVIFFYMYAACALLDLLLVCNLVPIGSTTYSYFAAMYVASICTAFWILLLNGFVGFQWAEDGTRRSLWSFRLSGGVAFSISFIISLFTFDGIAGLGQATPLPLFIILYLFNAAAFLVYVGLQVVLVVKTLEDRWPLGDIFLGAFFFAAAQAISAFLSPHICKVTTHYVDGMFFSNLFVLLAVMMVFKYWDSITKDDLEFSVGAPVVPAFAKKDASRSAPHSSSGTLRDRSATSAVGGDT